MNVVGGTLSGIGVLDGRVNLQGGTIRPGNSPGIMTVGSYNASSGQHLVEINGQGNVPSINNSLLAVSGTAILVDGTTLNVHSDDGAFFIGGQYTILTASTLAGMYSPNIIVNTTLKPVVVYDYSSDTVSLDYRPPFLACAFNDNGANVAEQLFTISTPDAVEAQFISSITSLECPEIGAVLDELSGGHYPDLILTTELIAHQFVRRLFDPVREFLSRDPCHDQCDSCEEWFEFWADAGGMQNQFDSCRHSHGLKNHGWQVTAGVQTTSHTEWLIGAALTYERTTTDFKYGPSGDTSTILGGFYAGVRLCDFYFLGDLAFGGSQSDLKRSFEIGGVEYLEHGKPESLQGLLYMEFGRDWRYECLVMTPFLGLEAGCFSYKKFHENGGLITDLDFHKRTYGTFDTRLGVHLIADQFFCGLFVGVDLAWQYRCTNLNNYFNASFVEFGDSFQVRGTKLDPNSLEVALNLEQTICDNFSVFATGYWQQWPNASAWDVLAGVSFAW
jgi:uncharacterized protein with beta-barrel porin domain